MVGAEGFEPSTFCSRSKRATRLRYAPTLGVASSKKRLLGEKQNSAKYIISSHHSQGTKTNIIKYNEKASREHGKPFASWHSALAEKLREEAVVHGLVTSEHLAAGENLTGCLIERSGKTRAHRSVRHDERNGVRIASLDGSVRVLTVANALHPVAHMSAGERIATSVGGRLGLLVVGRKLLFFVLGALNALIGDNTLNEVDRSVRTMVLLDIPASRVRLAGGEHSLEALARIVILTVFENRGERIEAHAAVVPGIGTARGNCLARILETGEPRDRIDLVAHPLTRNAGRERPEETELEILARIELVGLRIAVEEPHIPVDILLLERGDKLLGTAPAAALVDVPAEIDIRDVAELAAADVVVGGVVGRTGTALGADLENSARLKACVTLCVDGIKKHIGGIHILGHRLLAIGILARIDGVRSMLGVLEVRRGDDHCINILGVLVKVDIAPVGSDIVTDLLLDLRLGVFEEALLPEVGNSDQIEVKLLVVVQEARQE